MRLFGRKESAESKLEKSEKENAQLKNELIKLSMNIKSLSEEKKIFEKQIESFVYENNKLTSQLSNSKAQYEQISTENYMLKDKLSKYASTGYPQFGMANSYHTQIRELESQLQTSNSANSKLKEDLNLYITLYSQLETKNNELKSEKESMKANIEIMLKQHQEKFEHEANQYKRKIEELTEELSNNKKSVPNLSETNTILSERIQKLNKQIEENEKDINKKNEKILYLETEVKRYREKIEKSVEQQMEACAKLISDAVTNSREMADRMLIEKQKEGERLNTTPQEQKEVFETLTMNYNKILKENETLKSRLRSALIRLS